MTHSCAEFDKYWRNIVWGTDANGFSIYDDEKEEHVKISYCPWCGAKL